MNLCINSQTANIQVLYILNYDVHRTQTDGTQCLFFYLFIFCSQINFRPQPLRRGCNSFSDVLTTFRVQFDLLLGASTHLQYLSLMWKNNNEQQTGGRARANTLSTAPSFDTTRTLVFPQRLWIPNMFSQPFS